jgi:hypothetical protein
MFQKIELFMTTATRTSNPVSIFFFSKNWYVLVCQCVLEYMSWQSWFDSPFSLLEFITNDITQSNSFYTENPHIYVTKTILFLWLVCLKANFAQVYWEDEKTVQQDTVLLKLGLVMQDQ